MYYIKSLLGLDKLFSFYANYSHYYLTIAIQLSMSYKRGGTWTQFNHFVWLLSKIIHRQLGTFAGLDSINHSSISLSFLNQNICQQNCQETKFQCNTSQPLDFVLNGSRWLRSSINVQFIFLISPNNQDWMKDKWFWGQNLRCFLFRSIMIFFGPLPRFDSTKTEELRVLYLFVGASYWLVSKLYFRLKFTNKSNLKLKDSPSKDFIW